MTKFKVGDRVKCVESHNDNVKGYGWKKDLVFNITKITDTSSNKPIYFGGKNSNGVFEHGLIAKNYKPKKPTHIVVWDEGCGDPAKFFTDEKEAKEFIKELSENPKTIKDSIVFAEVRNVKKMSITKTLKYSEHKI